MTDPSAGAPPAPELDEPDAEPRARISARSVAVWSARASGGIVGVAIAVVVAIAALFVTPPSWSVAPPVVVVQPEPATQVLVCPGPLLRLADDSGQNASQATPVGTAPQVDFLAESGRLTTSAIAQSDAGIGGSSLAPRLGLVVPVDGEAPVVAGVQSSRIPANQGGGIVGYAATSCEQPALRSWIIGGSTQLGRTSILTIVNPSSVEAVVDLDLRGQLGAIDAVGLTGIVVPAGSQRVVPVSGFSLEQRAPVIGVRSTGGNVAVFLQQSIIRTLTPGGVDLIGAQDPSPALVIPGIAVAGETALAGINTTPADQDDTMPTLRLFAPSGRATTATVALVPTGSTLADALGNPRTVEASAPTDAHADAQPTEPEAESFTVELAAGAVSETPIERVAPGDYTIVVTASEPLVGAVRASVATPAGTDFAWYSPAGALGDRAALPAPRAPQVVLALANPTAEDRSVTLAGPDGDAVVKVPAGETVLTELEPGEDYSLSGIAGLRAAVRAGGDGFVAQFPLQPPAALAKPVRVHV
ncbi:MAG: hypothetical protein BGO95_02840 [Micrococcales bacterium 73-13]|mgnify:CR=1 FL=1|nr:MAG: hypothetical protein BGO95_02840 [Micrococcales bacterium 73-13]